MRAFISYSHEPDDRRFAHWLYDELKRLDFGLDPVIDSKDLPFGPRWRDSLPGLVTSCEILLLVRSRFSLSAPYCRFELGHAEHNGLLVGILAIESDTPWDAYADQHVSVDFTKGRQLGVDELRQKIQHWDTPAGRSQLDDHHDRYETDRRLRNRDGRMAPRTGETRANSWPPRVHGHRRVREDLRSLLAGDDVGVIVVSGPAGIGKSTLVRAELAQVEQMSGQRRPTIHFHQARPGRMLSADVMESLAADPVASRPDGDGVPDLAEFVAMVEGADVVIAIDSFENLVDRTGAGLLDLELDEVLEQLARLPEHRVKVVLITRELPHSRRGSSWLLSARHIRVDEGLDPTQFGLLLRDLDQRSDLLSPTTPESVIADACRLLRGRPRLAEFVCARASRTFHTIDDVVRELEPIDPSGTAGYVFDEFVAALGGTAGSILQALAALGTPVDEAVILEALTLVSVSIEETRLRSILRWLVSRNAVSTAAGLFYLQDVDRDRIRRWMPRDEQGIENTDTFRPKRSMWLAVAVDVLWRRFLERPDSSADEFDYAIAAVDAMIAAGRYRHAVNRLDEIDKLLHQRRRNSLLLHQRLQLRGRLSDDFLELVNDTAIGIIYLNNGLYEEAQVILSRARALEVASTSPTLVVRTHVNLGSALMKTRQTTMADTAYRTALEVAAVLPPDDQVPPLEGIANCHRRWGEFDAAYDELHRALTIAEGVKVRVRLNLRLARWYAMDGNPQARVHLEVAGQLDGDQPSVEYLDQVADQKLADGDVAAAVAQAKMAERAARRVGDPVALVRARTTLAFASLESDEQEEAWHWARLAGQDRPGGRNLLILSLCALTERLRGDGYSAREHFGLLRDEAEARREHDHRDYTAEGFLAFALCGRHVCDGSEPLEPAIGMLRNYARPAETGDSQGRVRTPPQFTFRLRRLIEHLADSDPNGALDGALEVLRS